MRKPNYWIRLCN